MVLREFMLGDIPAIAEIRNQSISISPDFFSMTVDRFRYDLYDEDVPMQSRLMVAEEGGRVLGYYHLYSDENQLARGRVNLDSIHVHPSARSEGAGSQLLESVIEVTREWKGRYISTAVPEDSPRSIQFLERHGFKQARVFFKMRLSDLSRGLEPQFPSGLSLRTFLRGEDEAQFVDVFNRAFADHWDFTPITELDVAQWNRRPAFNSKGCFLLFDGDRLIGFTTVIYDPERAAQTGEAVARIFEMGILPEYRRRGLGFLLLQRAVAYARERGFKALDLVTDAENEASMQLYEKMGFQERRSTIVLHREV